MIAAVVAVWRFLAAVGRTFKDPTTRGLVVSVGVVLAVGTVFYTRIEGWSVVDSLYFSVITLLTIGYGDLAPTSDASKLFTVVYALVGVGVLASFVTVLVMNLRRRPPTDRRRADD
ncbi:MAG: potassium channel family protein [Acidimicrobiales bacterium]